ncbi:MAG: polysaccharide deacetylase family protein [Gemmatimonadales bacterium]
MALASRLRRAALSLASASGALHAVGRSDWRRRRLTILCYHGLALEHEHLWRPGLYVTPEQFGKRLARLTELGATVLPLEEGLWRLRNGTLPRLAVAITFDDGGTDFHSSALPLLRATGGGMPSTVYLTTYYCLAGGPIYSLAIDYLLWRGPARVLEPWPAMGITQPERFDDERQRAALTARMVAATRGPAFPVARREQLLYELAARLGGDTGVLDRRRLLRIMTPDQVSECARNGVTVQLHTHRHRTPRDPFLFRRELDENAGAIKRMTGATPQHFCYPSGDYAPEMFDWLASAGVSSAVTCDVALAAPTSDRFLLPRFLDTSQQPEAAFDGWVTGGAAWVSRPPQVRV